MVRRSVQVCRDSESFDACGDTLMLEVEEKPKGTLDVGAIFADSRICTGTDTWRALPGMDELMLSAQRRGTLSLHHLWDSSASHYQQP